MANGGLLYFISYLFKLVLFDNTPVRNAISAQIFKPFYPIIEVPE